MAFQHEIDFLKGSILNSAYAWDWDMQRRMAALKAPDYLLGVRRELLQGDISREWTHWIVEQFFDVDYLNQEATFPKVCGDVQESLDYLVGQQLSDDDKINLSEVITEHLIKKIERENTEKRRPPITQKIRKELISIYGDRPRCWLTGYQFSSQAVEKFIDSDPRELPLPLYVDKYMPI